MAHKQSLTTIIRLSWFMSMLLVLVAIECTIERPYNRKNIDIREISVHSHFEGGKDVEDSAMTTS
jgi:hypothetical protein